MNTEVSKKSKFIYLPLLVLMFTQIGTSGDNAVLSVATNALMSALHANMNDIQLANMVYSLCAGAIMMQVVCWVSSLDGKEFPYRCGTSNSWRIYAGPLSSNC